MCSATMQLPVYAQGFCQSALKNTEVLVSLEADQRAHWHAELSDLFCAAEIRQVNDEAGGEHVSADLLEEFACGFGGAAGGDKIVNKDHPLALYDGVLVHLHLVDAIFERVANADALERQLALLADRDETGRHLMGDRAAENEAARLDARNLIDFAAGPGLHQFVDGAAEGSRVAEERGDVAKDDPRLRIIRYRPDRGLQVGLERGGGHGLCP